jgi:hypothetical protein
MTTNNEQSMRKLQIKAEHRGRVLNYNAYAFLATCMMGLVSLIGPPIVAFQNTLSNPHRNTNLVHEYFALEERSNNLERQIAQEETLGMGDLSMYGLTIEQEDRKTDFLKQQLKDVESRSELIRGDQQYQSFVKWRDNHFTSDDGLKILGYSFGLPALSLLGCLSTSKLFGYRSKRRMNRELEQLDEDQSLS